MTVASSGICDQFSIETCAPRGVDTITADKAVQMVEKWIDFYTLQLESYGLSDADILAIRERSSVRVRKMADLQSTDPLILTVHNTRRDLLYEPLIRHVIGCEWRKMMAQLSFDGSQL